MERLIKALEVQRDYQANKAAAIRTENAVQFRLVEREIEVRYELERTLDNMISRETKRLQEGGDE